jgi:hypothetical protein
MDIYETREQRLRKYKKYALKRVDSVLCPVCEKPFKNKYSLANHFLIKGFSDGIRFIDKEHEDYWLKEKEEKKERHLKEVKERKYEHNCWKCGKLFVSDYEHRFQKYCVECLINFPPKKKKPQNEFKNYPCSVCGTLIRMKLNANNKICKKCREKEREQEIQRILSTPIKITCLICKNKVEYTRKHVRDRVARLICPDCKNNGSYFKKHPKYDKVLELLRETTLTRREIKSLLGLEIDYVREAAIDLYGEEWYKKRVKMIRKRGQLQSCYQCTSGLELSFTDELKVPFETNKWIVLKIDGECYKSEIDVKVPIGNRKFAILIDGESFHGPKKFYRKDAVDKNNEDVDNVRARALADMGYFTIRYSETEVNSGWAIKNFSKLYTEFSLLLPSYYLRNWITGEEIKKY